MLTPKQLQLTESFDSIWSADAVAIGNQYLAIGPLTDYCMDEDYSLLGEECFYLILDSHSLLPVCHITVSEDDDPIYFLPDGSGYINSGAMIDFDGDIVHQTPMLNRYTHLTATVKGYPMYVYFGAPHDQITVLYEGKEPLTVPVPEYLIQDERFDYLGNNG